MTTSSCLIVGIFVSMITVGFLTITVWSDRYLKKNIIIITLKFPLNKTGQVENKNCSLRND